MAEQKALLRELYENPRLGFSATAILRVAKKRDPSVTLNRVKDFIRNHEVGQQRATATEKQVRRQQPRVVARDYSYQADLTFYEAFKRFNSGYYVLLTIVEITTKKAFVYMLKSKHGSVVAKALAQFYEDAHELVSSVTTDAGSEFNNGFVRDFFREHFIEHRVVDVGDKQAMSIVERFNRTIRDKIATYMDVHRTRSFYRVLPDLVAGYNDTEHSATRKAPNEMTFREADEYRAKLLAHNRRVQKAVRLKVGDTVRVRRKKETFEKGPTYRFSREVYEIVKTGAYRAELDNGERVPYYNLRLAERPAEPAEPAVEAPEPVAEPMPSREELRAENRLLRRQRQQAKELENVRLRFDAPTTAKRVRKPRSDFLEGERA